MKDREMKKINVFDLFGDSLLEKEECEKISKIVLSSIDPVILDFSGVRVLGNNFSLALAGKLSCMKFNDKIVDFHNISKSACMSISRFMNNNSGK